MQTGFIGLGAMGYFMALNLHKAGLLSAVWNRNPAKAEALAAEIGVTVATDPVDLAQRCEVIMICVSADQDVLEVIDALLPGLRPGSVVADTSTISSDTARLAAEKLQAIGVNFLDTPVSGGVEGARNARLSIMAGGDAAALERARPALEAISARLVHMGPVGTGQATKAVNQIMAAGIAQGVTEALAFGQAYGLDMDKVIEVVGSGAAANWFLAHRGPTMVRNDFSVGFKVALHHKDLSICKAMADRFHASLISLDQTLPLYERLVAEGHGDEDISALFRIKQRLFEQE